MECNSGMYILGYYKSGEGKQVPWASVRKEMSGFINKIKLLYEN